MKTLRFKQTITRKLAGDFDTNNVIGKVVTYGNSLRSLGVIGTIKSCKIVDESTISMEVEMREPPCKDWCDKVTNFGKIDIESIEHRCSSMNMVNGTNEVYDFTGFFVARMFNMPDLEENLVQ